MKVFVSAAALAVLVGASFSVTPVSAETLRDAFAAAYRTSPVLLSEQANLRRIDEGVPQALSGWRPTVTWDSTAGVSHRESDSLVRIGGELVPRNDTQNLNPVTTALTVTQPLYRGGRTVAGTESAEAQVQSGRFVLRAVEQGVFLDTVTAYMDVLRDMAVVQLNFNNVKVLERQLEAAQDRFEVGEVTRTDVAQAEARLAGAVSDRVVAEGGLEQSRATYARVVGEAPSALEPPPPLPPLPASEAEVVEIALAESPDLSAASYLEAASRHDIRLAAGDLLPVFSLVGTLSHTEETARKLTETDSASLIARLDIPLYRSGIFYSRVREARQLNNLRRVQVEDVSRRVREQATQAWEELLTRRAQIVSNREQVRANEIALEGVIQEAQVGSRTTLDVLDAEQELLDAQVELVRSERDEYVAAFALQAAIGRLTVETLNLPVERYDPTVNYQRVRNKWFGTDGGLR